MRFPLVKRVGDGLIKRTTDTTMDSPTATFIQIMRDRVTSLREDGNLDEALHASNASIEKCQSLLSTDLDSIDAFASGLEERARIYLDMGMYAEAIEDAKHAIDQLDNRPDRLGQVGRLYALMGTCYDGEGQSEKTLEAWVKAKSLFEAHEPPLMMDVATMANNLGFFAKAAGDLDTAEDHFLKALEIMNTEVGTMHEETASVCNNLGAVYFAAGYFEQAREMHMMALEARRELFGESHPDTAQSHNNLALAMLETGDRGWARRHFEKALAGFESLGLAYGEDLEAVASNYCEFLKTEGEGSLSEVIAARVRDVLAAQ